MLKRKGSDENTEWRKERDFTEGHLSSDWSHVSAPEAPKEKENLVSAAKSI